VIPKAELHVHLEASAPPALLERIGRRNGVALPEGALRDDGRFAWRDFLDFLAAFDRVVGVIRTPEDYREVTYEYLVACAAEGALYVELTASPDHASLAGLPYAEQIAGIAEGIDEARDATGIEARIVVTCVRNFGTERAERVARWAAAHPHPYVTGFGMAGDEAGYPPAPFRRAYDLAADAGLGLTIHAGEWAGAESVRAALELPVTRIGHGVRASEDPALVAVLAERGIVLECCPTSNVALGIYRDYDDHPFPALLAAGVRVTLGSDDPPWWGATIGGEYEVARRRFGLDEAALREITRTALDAAFLPPDVKADLLVRV